MKKVVKYSFGRTFINSRIVNFLARKTSSYINFDYKKFMVGLMRGFPPGQDLSIYRFRPCNAMLAFLYHRLATFDEISFEI